MKATKIYIVGGDYGYANWMMTGENSLVDSIDHADLVVFTGGEDVSPALYEQPKHPKTYTNPDRDVQEMKAFDEAFHAGKHMIGICRGSQFLCVMSGGILIQDQQNPSFFHKIDTYDGKQIEVTSTHHQAQYPWRLPQHKFKVLGWSKHASAYHHGGDGEELVDARIEGNKEVEIAYYPHTKCLAIQSHPEMVFADYNLKPRVKQYIDYVRELLSKHMDNSI